MHPSQRSAADTVESPPGPAGSAVRRATRRALIACALLSAGAGLPGVAQTIPGLPSFGSTAAPAAAASEPTVQDWAARLASAREEHARLLALPPGSAPLLGERQMASARRVVLLSTRVDAQQDRAGRPATRLAPIQKLSGEPPYSVLEVDALRDRFDILSAQQSVTQRGLKSLDATLQAAIATRADADAQLRLRREQAASRGSVGGTDEQRARLELAELMAQVAALEVIQADDARQRARAQLATLDTGMAELRAEIGRAGTRLRLDDADLARVLKGIDTERKRWAAESARIAERLARRESQLAAPDTVRGRLAEPLNQALQMIGDLDILLRSQETLWRGRQAVLAGKVDVEPRRDMVARIAAVGGDLAEQRRRLSEEERLLRSGLHAQQALVADLDGSDPSRNAEEQVLRALQTQLEVQDRLREGLDRTLVLLERARVEAGGSDRPANAGEWVDRAGTLSTDWARSIWQYELFSATETTQIDGRLVTVEHGVTVGKSIGMLVMLALGYWASGGLARLLVQLIGRRVPLTPNVARVMRRWIKSILLLAVVLLVLRLARIPLTAFAFLGGALAIGIGFGTQTIIKNLISGVIILFERKIRVGDIVTVGGMSGTVTTVDLRATTVRGFDGIDTIVPNSTLLENQLNNWSGGSPDLRRTIAVGVAYGSDVRQAAQIILRCAQGNPDVLAQPAADVLFEDFGADSLLLRLRYWTRLDSARGGPGVDSDLRFAILDALAEAGIVIAFPQRDVHLDVAGPLRVELGTGSAPPPSTGRNPG